MATQKTHSITILGLIVLAILFLVINMASSTLFTGVRADLTENELYTLTKGTRNILSNIDEPITIYLFFSDKTSEGVPLLRTYATRVKELLLEYAQLSNGKIDLNFVDPVPYSEEEDQANAFGLQGLPVGSTGDNVYFGLAASNAVGETEIISFFQPQREQFLEYDVTKLIYTLTNPKKTVVGVITQLPMFGGFDMETTQMTQAWAIVEQMRQLFELKQLDLSSDDINEDIDVLLVVHPKNLSDAKLYAIDQFIMRGGNAIFFVDPHSEIDTPVREQNTPLEVKGSRSSDLKKLFDAWGIKYDPSSVVLDRQYALTVGGGHQGQLKHYALLGVTQLNIDSDDVISSELEVISVGIAGHLGIKEDSALNLTPIVTSSNEAKLIDAVQFRFLPDPNQLSKNFTPTGENYTFVGRVQGKLNSAFPDGQPSSEGEDSSVEKNEHVNNSEGDANLLIVTDTDLLSDRMWVQVQEFFGQKIYNSWANNSDLVINAVDNLIGSSDLISIRSRETSSRPFVKVNELSLVAEQKFRSTEESLQAKLAETEQKLVALQKQRDDSSELLLSPEQESELQKFQQEKYKVRKELRQVRHSLDRDIERLGSQLKFINIGLVPIIISIATLFLYIIRSRRKKRALGL